MKRADALRIIADHIDEYVRDFGVAHLSVFGSVARDEASDVSDVDVLVEYRQDADVSYFRLFALRDRLSRDLGVDVDLVPLDGLREELRDGIVREAVRAA